MFFRHFPGELLSVNPAVVRKMDKVFELNERVAYLGRFHFIYFDQGQVDGKKFLESNASSILGTLT